MKGLQDWETKPLGQVAQITMGQSPDSKYYSEEEDGLPFLQGCAEFQARFPQHVLYCSQVKKVAPSGSILFSVRAPVGRRNIADRKYIIGRGLAAISAESIDQAYLEHHLSFIEPEFRIASQGSTFEAINSSELSGWPINFPASKPEQSKIAELLSTVDQAIEETEALIAKQQRIKTGLMQDLLTRGIDQHGNLRSEETHQFKDSPLGRIPQDWEVKILDDLLMAKQYGISTSLADEPIGIPVLRMNNLVNGEVAFTDLKYSGTKEATILTLNDGDILFNRTNSIDYVGRTAVFRGYEQPISFASYLVRLVSDCKKLHPEYLNLWLNDRANQIRVKQIATIGVQQANVNPTNLGKLSLALPKEINEQERIIEVLSTTSESISDFQAILCKLRSLKTGLMQDLLTGKKRVTPLMTVTEV